VRHRHLSLDRHALIPLLLAAFLLALTAPSASAAPDKPYRVTLSPASVSAGVTVDAYTVTLTNETKTQQLGSADVTAPTAFTLEGTPTLDRPGTVTRAGNLLALRNLSLPPGQSVTVTVGVRMTCVAGGYNWSFQAKQSNDFSGPPGNDLGPILGSRTTTVTDVCRLRFVAQPRDAEKNFPIRALKFIPNSGNVSVEAIDGSSAPERLTWFQGEITMLLAPTTSPGRLDPAGTSENAVNGLASFDALTIDAAGKYNVVPRTNAAGFELGPPSDAFTIVDVAEPCDANNCRAQLAGGRSTSTLTGAVGTSTGVAVLSLNIGTDPVCTGYTPPTADWFEFEVTAARDKTIALAYTKLAMKAFGKGKEFLEICFAAPTTFATKGAPPQPFDYDGDPANGAEGFVGLLPDCTTFASPCITARDSLGSGGAQISFFVPDSLSDPRFH
jgi:hypothetical protein